MKTLRDIGEDALIRRLIELIPRDASPTAGPGDDCAVIDPGPQHAMLQLLKTDALVGGIHFMLDAPASAVGWKAAARVISDFAAMGGRPDHFLITLALPPETLVSWAENLYQGIGNCLRTFGGVLAGGETSAVLTGSAPVISVAATGSVLRENLVLRSTAKPGQSLLVTGSLGGSIRGKHLNFRPRLEESTWLVSRHKPTAMMDLSDGLACDLPRLAESSGCGFVLDHAALPITAGCTVKNALNDGEDFELLFALDNKQVPILLDEWRAQFPQLPLTVIGKMTEHGMGDSLTGGWDHFPRASR